jgi:tetratricopeptide (TPR) repeat protein
MPETGGSAASPQTGRSRRGVQVWEAIVLAIVVGGASYVAGMRNGLQTERRRAERAATGTSPHGEGMGAPAEASMPPMDIDAMRARLAGFSHEELLQIANQHLDQARMAMGGADDESSRRRFTIAAAAYEKALELTPNDPNVLMDLGTALQGLGDEQGAATRFNAAAAGYEKALQAKPNDPDLLTDLGIVRRGLGDPQGAIARFRQAAKADPKHLKSRFNLGLVLLYDLDKKDEAVAAWEDYLKLAPKDDQMRKMVEAQLKELKG